ncbi:MAG: hypothetical protein HY236_13165 [Acidobacteria bacterium]|nr:hypothetical protein [Acidobacteriota bacterium]
MQRFFDQGLTLVFGFNHEEAIRSFQRAAELDPQAAMPYWGIALALGPNINMGVDPAAEKAAYEAVQKARALAAKAPEHERAYIEALVKRYSNDPKADLKKLAVDYKNAMGELVKRYPEDLDAATLYAEAMMDLRPWKLWTLDGKPAEGTEEIVAVLESVLRRNPQHPGANHYYIHAVEASRHPERALASAKRLETLVPAAGHLVHMPAHIYMRTGDYRAAARSNEVAAEADREYIQTYRVEGMYPLMYYGHNLQFLAAAAAMAGKFAEAKRAAEQLVEVIPPGMDPFPLVEYFSQWPIFMELRFHRWGEILSAPAPRWKTPITTAVEHFARGMAYAGTGKPAQAEAERNALSAALKDVPPDAKVDQNYAASLLDLAGLVLGARIAAARGDRKKAIEHWRKAVEANDRQAYSEPPEWYYPVRESLGGALLLDGQYTEAEKVFRADLERNPRNGRSLFGLWESLKRQGKTTAAEWVRWEFEAAWKSDVQLRVEEL